MTRSLLAPGLIALALTTTAQAQDLVVDGSLCVGLDCPGAPAFGSDTIRLQEDNLRIHFDDTSNSGSFPANDWRIIANDTANGGGNYLAFEDSTASELPFRVDAGADTNALRVTSTGRVGLGTGTPVVELHIVDGDSPSLRLEQDGSAGFDARAWDIVGNESNFFVRDATTGLLPFRILDAAPADALVIETTTGDVGFGTDTPTSALHVVTATGNAADMLKLQNNGGSFFTLSNTASGRDWFFTHENAAAGRFIIGASGNGPDSMFYSPNGNMTIGGTLTENSDKHAKMAIEPVDAAAILDKVSQLPVAEWSYKDDDPSVRHVGPMAQDFYAAFGLGHTETGIASLDTSGVALASIKALYEENQRLKAKDVALQAHVEALTRRLNALEAARQN